MRVMGWLAMFLVLGMFCTAALPEAWAAEAPATPVVRSAWPRPAIEMARGLQLVMIGVALGAIVLLFRTILPGMAAAADRSVARLTTKRLFLAGLVPLLGIGLIGKGLEVAGVRDESVVAALFALVLVIPASLLMVAGLCAALPHIGRSVLRAEPGPSPLGAAAAGGLIIGLAGISRAWPPLGVLVAILFCAWLLGIGIGTLVRPAGSSSTNA